MNMTKYEDFLANLGAMYMNPATGSIDLGHDWLKDFNELWESEYKYSYDSKEDAYYEDENGWYLLVEVVQDPEDEDNWIEKE